MEEEIYTKEQEMALLERTFREMGYYPNHNYFIAERGIRPYLQVILNAYPCYITMIYGADFLFFAEDHLAMLKMKYLQDDPQSHLLKIDYRSISDLSVSRPFIQYCLHFKVEGKRYYFYIDANGSYSFNGLDKSDRNFNYLLEKRFKGLMK